MEYKTQTSVIRDYHNGILDEQTTLKELEKVIQYQRIRRMSKKMNDIIRQVGLPIPSVPQRHS